MSIGTLREKSKENLEVAEWSEKKLYYDVAISRYYYSEYQKKIYISRKLNFYKKPDKSDNVHVNTISNFVSSLENKLSAEDKIAILNMKRLRRLRNDADYGEKRMEKNDYNLSFKFPFNIIQNITNQFL